MNKKHCPIGDHDPINSPAEWAPLPSPVRTLLGQSRMILVNDPNVQINGLNGGVTEEWIRLPKPKARFYGLSRTTLLELCESGAVKSTVLRKRHALRGIRLVFLPSLRAFLEQNATGGCGDEAL